MDSKVVNVRLTPELIQWLDSLIEREIYRSRSEAIRSIVREYLVE